MKKSKGFSLSLLEMLFKCEVVSFRVKMKLGDKYTMAYKDKHNNAREREHIVIRIGPDQDFTHHVMWPKHYIVVDAIMYDVYRLYLYLRNAN